ncbi:16S rRNA pseudouridylate synthase [Mycoplasma zalophi]|uniref:16S rRNA pseudouridylate synthase n=1 Tax=Mycoplasma zalophi TaxID=191287 RepID=A0ABS6DPP3_9MOLU|nr:pseudouridine synthase [Mycoplasma zalophi]MBU4692295.1 16S rRNA pseudouridylate synthase [Mycoplasma zalophi]
MRIEKFIADSLNISRTEIKKLINQKRIKVNNEIIKKSIQVTENDLVFIDDKQIIYEQYSYYMLHKPQGYICANYDNEHKTIFDLMNLNRDKFFSYGRLDKDTEGLLIISNDGNLSHKLLSLKNHVPKKYFLKTNIKIPDLVFEYNKPIVLNEKDIIKEYEFTKIDEYSCYLTIYNGLFHQVKRMMKFFDLEVIYLKRIEFGFLKLDPLLEVGKSRKLTDKEIKLLKQ